MSYQALYREWRPTTFAQVSGQEHIKQTLMNMLKQQRIPHALLFCGPRGTGKTTMAKILAKAVNCNEGVTAEPCLKCRNCTSIGNNTSMDVLEIDAASNRGIDEIRELREHVRYAPSELRYKVYIIDEVHMLTTEAFNALLKTLEEPPEYVLFILATTEPHKLPATIISRCQRFDFKRLSHNALINRLQEVAEAKSVKLSRDAAKLIADQAQGGMRDALGMLDQSMSFADGEVTLAVVETVTGSVPTIVYQRLLDDLADNNIAGAMEQLHTELTAGREASQYLRSYIAALRILLLVAHSPQVLEMQGYEMSDFSQLAVRLEKHLPDLIDLALTTENDMRYGGHPRLHLELLLVRQHQVINGLSAAEPKAEVAKPPAPKKAEKPANDSLPTTKNTSTQPAFSVLLKAWPEVIKFIKQRAPLTGAMMGGLSPVRVEGNIIILQLAEHNVHTFKRLSNPADLAHIAAGFQSVLGKELEVRLVLPSPEGSNTTSSSSKDTLSEVMDIFQGTIVKE